MTRAGRRWCGLVTVAVVVLGACGSDPTPDQAAFCEAYEELAGSTPFGDRPTVTPEEMAISFQRLRADAAALVDPAPDEARPAAERYLARLDRLIALLEPVGFDPRLVDRLDYPDAVERYSEAAQLLDRAAAAAC